jgi:replicative DNA helicase
MMDQHRPVPHSAEAEKGALGSMLIDPLEGIPTCLEKLRSEHFYIPAHVTIFSVLAELYEKHQGIDLITFSQVMEDRQLIAAVGGRGYLTELATFVPTAANVNYYIDIIRDKYLLRAIIHRGTMAVREAYESEEPAELLDRVQQKFIEVSLDAHATDPLVHIRGFVPEVIESIEATYHNRGKGPLGLPTGYVDLDRMTGGFLPGRTYYFGARPAMGKSSLATEFAEHVAIEANVEKHAPVAIFSVEMTGHELTEVILCRRASVDLVRLRDGFFSKDANDRLQKQAELVSLNPIYVDDTARLSIIEFRSRARRAVTKLGVKLLIIDYIQRMCSTSKRAQNNREQEINEIAQGISETAKELNVPIVVLAQLNRKSEERQDKTPELSDFRESGSLEQEAHLVGLLHRPCYYAKTMKQARQAARKLKIKDIPSDDDAEKRDDPTLPWVQEFGEYTMLIIAKQRRGPVGTIRLRFIKKFAQFQSEDEDRPLFSNRLDERQEKPPPAHDFIASIKDVFPNAAELGDEEGE